MQRPDDAQGILLPLLQAHPNRADFCNTAAQLYKTTDLTKALQFQRKAVEIKPSVQHLTNLATLLSASGYLTQAVLAAKQAVLTDEQALSARLVLSSLLNKAGRFGEALTQIAALPDILDKHILQTEAYIGLNQPAQAELHLAAMSAEPQLSPEQLRFVLTGWLSIGKQTQADQLLQHRSANKLDFANSVFLQLKAGSASEHARDKVAASFDKLNWQSENKAQLGFELAKSYKKSDKKAWLSWLHKANALHLANMPYDEAATLALFDSAMEKLSALPNIASSAVSAGPIFIVGMPRSGTTLVESILHAHSQCFACGETNALKNALQLNHDIADVSHQAFFDIFHQLDQLTADKLEGFAKRYLKFMQQFGSPLALVDKMPHNFIYTALIPKLFPNAKVIHVTRHPVATMLSIYEQAFSSFHNYGNDMTTLVRYYKKYQQFMQASIEIAGADRVYHLSYEQLVTDPEQQVKALLNHCQLPYEASCLQYNQQQRSVSTASVNQVRQGFYQSSLHPWEGLEQELQVLLTAFQ